MSYTSHRSLLTRPARLLFALALALIPILGLAPAPALAASGGCVTADDTVTCTFSYTGAAETWTVPAGVTEATFDLYGAGSASYDGAGKGGRVQATLDVAPGTAYRILVGGGDGFNGGGPGGKGEESFFGGKSGGGASDLRLSPYTVAERLLVAGGGGAVATGFLGQAGHGGYPAGGSGGGAGGSQTAGGAGAPGAGAGSLGQGGAGGDASGFDRYGGGGGGGGYYGGGGGRACEDLGDLCAPNGGGGGSSYATPTATNVSFETGVRTGHGQVIISYTQPVTIPPTSSAITSPASPNGTNGWFTSDVRVTFSATDNSGGSGINRISYSGGGGSGSVTPPGSLSVGFGGDGTVTLSYYAVDNAGNVEPLNTLTINMDQTPPTLSAAAAGSPNANGWYNGDVTVQFSCADNLSGVAACPADQALTGEGAAVSSTAQSATDVAGNTSDPSNVVTVAIDRTAPVVSVTGVTDGASYPLGSLPAVGCATSDALAGVATEATLSVTGGNPDGTGSFTATCAGATDNAGNAGSASVSYSVAYPWSGFLQPVDNLPAVNTAKAGSAIPVKFSLGGDYGLSIFAAGYPRVQQVACDSGAPASEVEQTVTAGASGLQYDAASATYTYVWKTDKKWGGGCRQLTLKLIDGSEHVARFQFR